MKIVISDFFEVAVACTNNNEDIKKAAHAVERKILESSRIVSGTDLAGFQ